jgi:plastocyanin
MSIAVMAAAGLFGWMAQAPPDPAASPGSVTGKVTVDQKLSVKGVKILESIVFLDSDTLPAPKPDPSKPAATIDQKNLTFVPRVTAIQAGSTVCFRNSDKELHNVLGRCYVNREFNNAVTPDGCLNVTLQNEETIVLGCNIHPDMRAYLLVLRNPYFAPLKEDGTYEIPNVPPGTYKLKVWNERFPTALREITVAAGKATTADFDFDSTKKVRYHERDGSSGGE